MNREETAEAIKVMQHYADGGEVEAKTRIQKEEWHYADGPIWDWSRFNYRIKKLSGECWATIDNQGAPVPWRQKPSGKYHPIKIRWEEV